MLIAYVDESYDRDFYFIAAAIASQEQWDALEPALDVIRLRTSSAHGTARDIEFHASDIQGGRGPWEGLRGKHREASAIYTAVLREARVAGVRYIFRGVDVARLNARYQYPDRPHSVVLGHLLERIDDYALATQQSDEVIVVADEVTDQEQHRAQFEAYRSVGTPGYRPSRLTRISAPINFASSRTVDGLQVADLAAYLHRRRSTIQERHPAARAARERMVAEIDAATIHTWQWRP